MVTFKLGYSLREALSHFKRNLSTSLGAVVTIFLSLFIIGAFVLGGMLVNNIVGDVENRVTIQAFVADDADQVQLDTFKQKLEGMNHVQEVTFKGKDEALAEYRETMKSANAQDAIAQLDGQNPVPASFVIKLDDPQEVETIAKQIMEDSDFAAIADSKDNIQTSVQYGAGSVENLFVFSNYLRIVGVVIVGLLVFVAFVFINNTIRLSIMARRREISIMRLVGASNSFIRGPFVTEGVLQALTGSLLAIISLELMRIFLLPVVANSLQFLPIALDGSKVFIVYAALVGIGLLIGLFGSALAMRRYLKV